MPNIKKSSKQLFENKLNEIEQMMAQNEMVSADELVINCDSELNELAASEILSSGDVSRYRRMISNYKNKINGIME